MANIDEQLMEYIEASDDPTELQQFTTWETIVPELKKHAMTYFDGKTLFEYAQASKLCNHEIQKFDENERRYVKLEGLNAECTDLSIEIHFRNLRNNNRYGYEMKFINMENNKHKWIVQNSPHFPNNTTRVFQTDETSSYDGSAMEGALKHLEHTFRNPVRNIDNLAITLKVESWPSQLSNFLEPFYEAHWLVDMNEEIYEDFMEFMENNPVEIDITIRMEDEAPFNLPSSFFDSTLFKTADSFSFFCLRQLNLTNEQFLRTKARDLTLRRTNITAETVNQKLVNWYHEVMRDEETSFAFLPFPPFEPRWDRNTVMGSLPFRQIEDNTYTITKEGAIGRLSFHWNSLIFRANQV